MGKADKPEKNNNKKQKHFWKDFKAELKKVIWPTRSQVVNNTVVVIVIVIIVTAICFVLDLTFEALNTYGIDKLKEAVQNSVSDTAEDESGESEENTNTSEANETESTSENSTEEENNTESNEIVNETAENTDEQTNTIEGEAE